MRALCWHGKGDVRVDTVPDPKIQHPRDAVIKITACAICGSDLHLLDGYQPTMESGDILGHENMGEVIELGSEVTNLEHRLESLKNVLPEQKDVADILRRLQGLATQSNLRWSASRRRRRSSCRSTPKCPIASPRWARTTTSACSSIG